jgi:signal peptidase I
VVLLALGVLSYFVFSRLGFQVVEVMGDSMHPTLRQSDHYLLKKWVYLVREPRPFEVVVIIDPQDTGFSVKRIIAAAGDTVELRQGEVLVNGIKLKEPYLRDDSATHNWNGASSQVFHLGPDQFFVLGDNREVSLDSRVYGPVPRRNVLGLITP